MTQQSGHIIKKKSTKKDDYNILLDNLVASGLLSPQFSGKVLISLSDGGINYIEKTETIK